MDVQMHDGQGQNRPAWLWQYRRPRSSVVFDFRLGRSRDGRKQFLGPFEGLLQTDGDAAYEQGGGPKIARFLEYPELELIPHLAENSLRPVALGRKHGSHVGSPWGGFLTRAGLQPGLLIRHRGAPSLRTFIRKALCS